MARLCSVNEAKAFIEGTGGAAVDAVGLTKLRELVDAVSEEMETEILGNQLVGELASGLKQLSATGSYGPEDYGLHERSVILLRRHLNVASITSVTDDGTALAAAEFKLDKELGAVRLLGGRRFSTKPRAVDVVYTAGYAETGSADTLKLSAPADLNLAAQEYAAFRYMRFKGTYPVGVEVVNRFNGSLAQAEHVGSLPKSVFHIVRKYGRSRGV